MRRLDDKSDPYFGTARLRDAWQRAVLAHPVAYLMHRATYLWNLLGAPTMTLELYHLDEQGYTPLAQSRRFRAFLPLHEWLESTPLFRLGIWLIMAAAICAGLRPHDQRPQERLRPG